jgi:integrase
MPPRRSKCSYYQRAWKGADGKPRRAWVVAWYGIDGVRYQRSGFATRAVAEAFYEKRVLPALEAGLSQPEEKVKCPTVREFFEQLLEERRGRIAAASYKLERTVQRLMCERLGAVRVSELTHRQVMDACQYVDQVTPSPTTVLIRRMVVKRYLKVAVERGYVDRNVAAELRIGKAGMRTVVLSPEEIEAVMAACRRLEVRIPSAMAVMALAINGGLRSGEIMHLEWSDVDFARGVVTVRAKPQWGWAPKTR